MDLITLSIKLYTYIVATTFGQSVSSSYYPGLCSLQFPFTCFTLCIVTSLLLVFFSCEMDYIQVYLWWRIDLLQD